MSATEATTEEQRDEILADSINRRLRVMVTHHLPEGWRTYKSSFLSGTRLSGTILLKVLVPENTPDSTLPQAGGPCGVTFRLGHKKCMFSTVVRSGVSENGALLVTVNWPENLEQLQRRAYERVAPPRDTVVAVRFWPEEPDSNAVENGRNIRHGQLEDVSASGMRVKTSDLGDIEVGRTYRCVFAPQPGAPVVIADAVLRHREAADHGRASLGFHFVGLEVTPEGRKLLDRIARIVIQFQRARRRRR